MSDKKKVVTFPHADQRLMGRARGAIVFRSYHGPLTLPDARISTLSDLINAALAAYLSELEQHYTGGTPFAAPEHLPRGRKRGAARQIDTSGLEKANAYLRPEIVERLRGAITYADAAGPLLGQIATQSQLLNAALERLLPRLEQTYNDGKPFAEVHGALPTRS